MRNITLKKGQCISIKTPAGTVQVEAGEFTLYVGGYQPETRRDLFPLVILKFKEEV
jgi:hypothetical protein